MKTAYTQTFTPEMAKLLNKIDRNTRGLAKLVSAQEHLHDFAENSEVIERCIFDLVQVRRNLRSAFEAELTRQLGWRK